MYKFAFAKVLIFMSNKILTKYISKKKASKEA